MSAPIYLFTEHAESLESNGLSEFGIRTAISKGVHFNATNFSDQIRTKIEEFRGTPIKTVYVSPDPKTWMTAALMYYPYTQSNTDVLTLKVSPLLAESSQKRNYDESNFTNFLKKYELNLVSVKKPEDSKDLEWGLETLMLNTNEPFVACVTHRTTMQAYVSKMKRMDNSMYEYFKSMWSMAVDYNKESIEIQEGVKSSLNDEGRLVSTSAVSDNRGYPLTNLVASLALGALQSS